MQYTYKYIQICKTGFRLIKMCGVVLDVLRLRGLHSYSHVCVCLCVCRFDSKWRHACSSVKIGYLASDLTLHLLDWLVFFLMTGVFWTGLKAPVS